MGNIASRFKWVFGTQEAFGAGATGAPSPLGANNILGSTGAGIAFNTHGWGEQVSFYVETDAAATCSYQIRTARTSSGPWAVVSSGTLSTGATNLIKMPGPFAWLSPRIKTLNSTANQVVVRMTAVES